MPSERRVGGKGDSYTGLTLFLVVKSENWPVSHVGITQQVKTLQEERLEKDLT